MRKRLVVGGWGVVPTILESCFSSPAIYIDCNPLMPLIINNGLLKTDWIEILLDRMHTFHEGDIDLAGWSTGAIIALALSNYLKPHSLTLLSGTLSFCRRDGYRHGIRSSVLSSMIQNLTTDPAGVVSQFYKTCGLDILPPKPLPWTPSMLIDGLHFLGQVDIRNCVCSGKSVHVFHGKDDSVIPFAAGELVADHCDTKIQMINSTHAFFTGIDIDLITSKDTQ
jgi:hypothetical protein